MNALRHRCFALLLGLFLALPAARADDIEIYNNPQQNPLKPPMTILVLDLNLLAICNNVLTNASNPRNPSAPQQCLDVRNSVLLSDLLGGVSSDPRNYLSSLLLGTVPGGPPALSAQQLCVVTTALGLVSPSLPLIGILGSLTCSTLSGLLSNGLTAPIVTPLLGNFVGQLVSGLLTPLLSTALGQLPGVVTGLLQTTLSGVLNLGRTGLISLLESILNQLINSRVAIMVSHADRSSAAGAPGADCAFGDLASIPTSRRETVGCSNGAYFLVGFTPLVDQGAVTQLLTRVSTLLTGALNPTNLLNSTTALLSTAVTTPTELLPPFQAKEVYAEIAHYLSGDSIYNAPLARWDGLTGVLTRDTSVESGSRYIQPQAQCDTVNVLNVQLTNNVRDNESDTRLRHYFPGAESAGAFALANVVKQAEDPGFVDGAGRKISLRSHFIVQENLTSLATLANLGVNVTSYANNLGLLGLGQSAAEFLQPVLQVDASLLTPSFTADPLKPGKPRAEAFFGGFRPSADQRPRWDGNLKKLEVRDSDGDFAYFDSRDAEAIAEDGRIENDALSFWSSTALLSGKPGDGRTATLGGAGQKIPGYALGGGGVPGRSNGSTTRKLFFDRYTSNVPSLAVMNADDADTRTELRPALGAANDSETQQLLLYARGYEVGSSSSPLGTGDALRGRAWMHGAVLHSRPVAVNYGARSGFTASNPDIRAIYGAADGWLRMVNNSNGVESWGFMPRAAMDQQKTLRDNQASARFPYGVDGAPTVVLRDRSSSGGPADGKIESGNSHDKAAVYFGLRRSGSSIYALNIKNPDSPSMLWRIGPDGLYNSTGLVSGSATQFAEMALTFSNPQAGRISYKEGSSTSTRSVIVFTAGYNGGRSAANARLGKDLARGSDNLPGSDDARGNAVYMVDADTGVLIWKARQGALDSVSPFNNGTKTFQHPLMADSFAADTTVVDSNGDGLIDRLYALDTGGRLRRADFAGAERADWTITPLASVGRQDNGNVANDRRFFHAPDYVPFRDANGAYDAVVFASGDREDPFNVTTPNFLYVYRDRAVSSGKALADVNDAESELVDHAGFVDLTSACASGAVNCGAAAADAPGWKLRLAGRGEKAMSQPLTSGGTVFLTTYVAPDPTSRACVPQEGSNRIYGVALSDSRPLVTSFENDGDGDRRSTDGGVPGLAGDLSTLGTNHIAANTQSIEARSARYYPVYWRERRGDDETPP